MNTLSGFCGDLVLGKNEYTYQQVIDDFSNSSYIGVVTYNISARNDGRLMQALKAATDNGTKVELITNIPKRFSRYRDESYAIAASKAIGMYLRLLNPHLFEGRMDSYFLFSNHAKILVTDNIAYWGSGNFSDESIRNYECGTITTDPAVIDYIKNEILPQMKEAAIPYYKHNFVKAIYQLQEATQLCNNMENQIFDASFIPYEDYETGFETRWIFNTVDSGITKKLLDDFVFDFCQYEDALSVIDDIVDDYCQEEDIPADVVKLKELSESYCAEFSKMRKYIIGLLGTLEALSQYNVESATNHKLERKYGMEAWDEALDIYAQMAFQEAQDEYENLIKAAEPAIREILDQFPRIAQYLSKMETTLYSLLVVSRGIDNTGVR